MSSPLGSLEVKPFLLYKAKWLLIPPRRFHVKMCSLPADKRGESRFITLAPAAKKKKMTDDESIFNYHSMPHLCLLQSQGCSCWYPLYFKVSVLIWSQGCLLWVNWLVGGRGGHLLQTQLNKCRFVFHVPVLIVSSASPTPYHISSWKENICRK